MGLAFGYQMHMEENLRPVFGDDEEEIANASWAAAWQKIRDTLHPVGKTYLAEVADFFDSLIRLQYGELYNPMETLRGPVVAADISARTFYEVMEKHLSRAIMRSGEDGWTGH